MGIKGSSTASLILEDVKVPVENVLGEIGNGGTIAFNILNVGRFKLGAADLGGCKWCIDDAVVRARAQAVRPAHRLLRAIRKKIAEMAAATFVRTASSTAPRADRREHRHPRQGRPRLRRRSSRPSRSSPSSARSQGLRHRGALLPGRRPGVQIHGGYGYSRSTRWTALPRRAHQPHLRGHQRDQPHGDLRLLPEEIPDGGAAVARRPEAGWTSCAETDDFLGWEIRGARSRHAA